MRVVVITPPQPVVTWEEAKAHLRLDDDDEQTFVEALIDAATGHIDGPDGWLGRAIGVQTLELRMPAFGCMSIPLPYPPAIEIVAINYVDTAGSAATLLPDGFELSGNMLRPAWPTAFPTPQWRGAGGDAVRIQYRAGYEVLPAAIRAAILLMVGDLYRNRVSAADNAAPAVQMPTTVANLLSPFRVWS